MVILFLPAKRADYDSISETYISCTFSEYCVNNRPKSCYVRTPGSRIIQLFKQEAVAKYMIISDVGQRAAEKTTKDRTRISQGSAERSRNQALHAAHERNGSEANLNMYDILDYIDRFYQ